VTQNTLNLLLALARAPKTMRSFMPTGKTWLSLWALRRRRLVMRAAHGGYRLTEDGRRWAMHIMDADVDEAAVHAFGEAAPSARRGRR